MRRFLLPNEMFGHENTRANELFAAILSPGAERGVGAFSLGAFLLSSPISERADATSVLGARVCLAPFGAQRRSEGDPDEYSRRSSV